MKISSEDLKIIRRFEEIMQKGYYADGKQVTDLHNKILGTRLAPTNCGSCIRSRISALVATANKFEKSLQLTEVDNTPEENKASDEPKKAVKARKKKE